MKRKVNQMLWEHRERAIARWRKRLQAPNLSAEYRNQIMRNLSSLSLVKAKRPVPAFRSGYHIQTREITKTRPQAAPVAAVKKGIDDLILRMFNYFFKRNI